MKFKEGNLVKSVLSGKIHKIKLRRDWIVTLDSLDGSSQVLTEKNNLNLFYETDFDKQHKLEASRG